MTNKTKLKGLPLYGALVGLIGGLLGIAGGSISIWNQFIPPQIEVLDVLPICITSVLKCSNCENDDFDLPTEAIVAVVHIRGGNRVTYIGGLDIVGNIYISHEEIAFIEGKFPNGENDIDILKKKWDKIKPFIRISWGGWVADSKTAIRVEPFEEKFIRIAFSDPEIKSIIFDLDDIEYKAKSKLPQTTSITPIVEHIFERYNPFPYLTQPHEALRLRQEVKSGQVAFSLRVGPKTIIFPKEKILEVKSITKDDWENLSPQKIYLTNRGKKKKRD